MTRIPFPSLLPQRPQPETCFLCQRLVNRDEIYESDVEGLRGRIICIYHGDLGTNLSHNDLRGVDDTLRTAIAETPREEPFGDTPWWSTDGDRYLLIETADGPTVWPLRQEDGLSGFRIDPSTP